MKPITDRNIKMFFTGGFELLIPRDIMTVMFYFLFPPMRSKASTFKSDMWLYILGIYPKAMLSIIILRRHPMMNSRPP